MHAQGAQEPPAAPTSVPASPPATAPVGTPANTAAGEPASTPVAAPGATPAVEPAGKAPAAAPNKRDAKGALPCGERFCVTGFGILWFVPHRTEDDLPEPNKEAFRLRFARVIAEIKPDPDFTARIVVALEQPMQLFDFQMTWQRSPYANVSAGQFKIPFGASILTPGAQLVMMERPSYVLAMSKATFRDVGVMVHSGEKGLFRGVLGYAVGVFNGTGRVGIGSPRELRDPHEYLYVGRLTASPPAGVLAKGQRLTVGMSYARSEDPAIAMGPTAAATAANYLGTSSTPFLEDRVTQLVGLDATLSLRGMWLQAELMRLVSEPVDDTLPKSKSFGYSVEAGYTYAPSRSQVAARVDSFDPSTANADKVFTISAGVNQAIGPRAVVSVFGSMLQYHPTPTAPETSTAAEKRGGRVESRLLLKF